MKEYYIKLSNELGYILSEGESIVEAATRLYEKLSKERDSFLVSLICEGYPKDKKPTPDNIYLFTGAMVAANAGDHEFSQRLEDYGKKIGDEDL